MHAFRTSREFLDHAWTSPESHPNILRLHETPLTHRFLLACIRQTETTSTGDIFIANVDQPVVKCFLPGLPRATYMPFPFQIVQSPQYVSFTYEFAFASRVVNIGMKSKAPVDSWMG
jgi:hypothetical protein